MSDDLLSLRIVLAGKGDDDRDLFRKAVSSLRVPVELECADGVDATAACINAGSDLVYVDKSLPPAEMVQIVAAARAAPAAPFTVLLTAPDDGGQPFVTDAVAAKPDKYEQARRLIERSIRVRLPSRALIVDDSPTMRSIVRKLLSATRFPLEISEADEGFTALKRVREAGIDLVFLDHNMPGLSGIETLAEFKREKRRLDVVIMTSAEDESLPDRARDYGAAFLKKPFYPADIEAVLCRFYGLRALNRKLT
jgi:CheY-like chemotaxis protein